jgi:hypothetical protein
MRRTAAALALIIAFAVPAVASAEGGYWAAYKRSFKHRPHAVILALPAIVATAPFMLVTSLVTKLTSKASAADDEAESDDWSDDE